MTGSRPLRDRQLSEIQRLLLSWRTYDPVVVDAADSQDGRLRGRGVIVECLPESTHSRIPSSVSTHRYHGL